MIPSLDIFYLISKNLEEKKKKKKKKEEDVVPSHKVFNDLAKSCSFGLQCQPVGSVFFFF
jgi:hypothetical protein